MLSKRLKPLQRTSLSPWSGRLAAHIGNSQRCKHFADGIRPKRRWSTDAWSVRSERRNKEGTPLSKRWRVEVNDVIVGEAINIRCIHPGAHLRLEGSDMVKSGNYTPEFSSRVIGALSGRVGLGTGTDQLAGCAEHSAEGHPDMHVHAHHDACTRADALGDGLAGQPFGAKRASPPGIGGGGSLLPPPGRGAPLGGAFVAEEFAAPLVDACAAVQFVDGDVGAEGGFAQEVTQDKDSVSLGLPLVAGTVARAMPSRRGTAAPKASGTAAAKASGQGGRDGPAPTHDSRDAQHDPPPPRRDSGALGRR